MLLSLRFGGNEVLQRPGLVAVMQIVGGREDIAPIRTDLQIAEILRPDGQHSSVRGDTTSGPLQRRTKTRRRESEHKYKRRFGCGVPLVIQRNLQRRFEPMQISGIECPCPATIWIRNMCVRK